LTTSPSTAILAGALISSSPAINPASVVVLPQQPEGSRPSTTNSLVGDVEIDAAHRLGGRRSA